MTYRERLQKEEPERVGNRYYGGCGGCPGDIESIYDNCPYDGDCTRCWDRVIPGTEEVDKYESFGVHDLKTIIKLLEQRISAQEIIIEKKDRTIADYYMNACMDKNIKINDLEQKIKDLNKTITGLNNECKDKSDRIQSLESACSAKNEEIVELDRTLRKYEATCNRYRLVAPVLLVIAILLIVFVIGGLV